MELESFPDHYIVGYAMIAACPGTEEKALQLPSTMLAHRLATDMKALMIPVTQASFVLIIPVQDHTFQPLDHLNSLVGQLGRATGIPFSMAVSGVHSGLSQLNAAFESCRACMASHSTEPGLHHVIQSNMEQAQGPMPGDDAQLYDALIAGDRQRCEQMIERILSSRYAFVSLEQRYYYARMPIMTASHTLALDGLPLPPAYASHLSPAWLYEQLLLSARALCTCVTARRQADNSEISAKKREELTEQVIAYIAQHYVRDDLSGQTICEAFGISEHVLSELCRGATGMNAFAYIQKLRMDRASALLRDTEEKVIDILQLCGYNTPNAFYKAFKRVYGQSPSEYRASYRNH